jgi:signal transduction histidine kinase
MQVQRKLFSAASLELKNSLNAVLKECALCREAEAGAPAENARPLGNIEKHAHEALHTVRSFLGSAIDQQGRLSVLRESIDLVAVVEDALNVCRENAEKGRWRLETQYAEDLPRTYTTDPARFRHVLRDVVDHAVRISDSAPMLIRVRNNYDFIEVNVSVGGARFFTEGESGHEPDDTHRPGELASERIETVRENLRLLNGHVHLVKLPGQGFEIGLCLPKGEQNPEA